MDDPDRWYDDQDNKKVTKETAREFRARSLKFVWAGLSGFVATLWVQPMSLIKIKMQMSAARTKVANRPSALEELYNIVGNCGYICLYRGISANLARQLVYTSTRFGIYYTLIDMAHEKGNETHFFKKFQFGVISGACAAFLSVPFEIAFVRLIADDALKFASRQSYVHVGEALVGIAKNEGLFALWRGASPTVFRGMIMNGTTFGLYSEIRERYEGHIKFSKDKTNRLLTAYSSIISAMVTSLIAAPMDLVKTRMQAAHHLIISKEYNGIYDCFKKIIREEGFFSLWRGFTPAILQNIPYTFILFLFYEEFNRKYGVH